ncbi:hypothetical protein GJ496_008694 [Pomphorhynchus laevis]|nr:hypothetical protein GJ496_008694 [Pomphorhynchus laevis]
MSDRKLTVILDNASLEVVRLSNKTYQLLNADQHMSELKQCGKSPSDCRPDITHQCLMMLLDSPLNRAGYLNKILIRTNKNVIICVQPCTRIPRTFPRFAALIVQLMAKFSIRSADNNGEKLIELVKGPIEQHLPSNTCVISTSIQSSNLGKVSTFAKQSNCQSIAVIIGAFAKGHLDISYANDTVALSRYPLSAALVCAKICSDLEEEWDVT